MKRLSQKPEQLCKAMTLEEKAGLVNGATFFGTAQFEHLGIPRMQLLDGGTGINFEQLFGDMADVGKLQTDSTNGMVGSTLLMHVIDYYFEPEKLSEEELAIYEWIKERLEKNLHGISYAPGCFPPGILLGATWNPDVVHRVGEALGKEAVLYGIHILLGTPNVNIHRDPLNGRLFEGYSEDPCLVSKLAPELVKGVQEYGVAANVKHFAANNQETNRVGINEQISDRALEEIYFPGFKACVKEGGVKTVMSAYNKINGVPCTESEWLLTQKLREEWGFDGVVLSDWGAVYHPVEALTAGNDLAMPGPIDYKPIVKAVEDGSLKETDLDKAVVRLLDMIGWVSGHFAEEAAGVKEPEEIKHFTDEAAYAAAAEGIVLLRNEELFPLQKGQKIALVGSAAQKLTECGLGSAGITTDRTSSLFDCLKEQLGTNRVFLNEVPADTDIVLCVVRVAGMEGNDRKDLRLLEEDVKILSGLGALKGNEHGGMNKQKVGLILNTCGPVDLTELDFEKVKGIFAMFLPGMEGGRAMADILTGKVNPSGKLPLTFPVRYEDTPTFLNFPGDGYEVCYGEGIYVGYRYYDKKKIEPLYHFGYGLSYTDFEITAALEQKDEAECGRDACPIIREQVTVLVDICNTGVTDGAEVVQLYVGDPYSTLAKPVRELKAFQKVFLKAGERKTVTFTLSLNDFASYDADLKEWTTEEGYYDLYVATSSADKDIIEKLTVYLAVKSPYSYGVTSTVKTLYEQPELKKLLEELWEAQEWDIGILESNYQYTPNKSLIDILPQKNTPQTEIFQNKAAMVRRL